MRHEMNQSPINPLPLVVWALALPMIAAELVFGLASAGLLGGSGGIGMRNSAIQQTAFIPELFQRMWAVGAVDGNVYRLFSYPFVHVSPVHALFVTVFTLALGNMIAAQFRPSALIALFFGSGAVAALIYTGFSMAWPGRVEPLIGGYPAVYGLVGAFTFLIWTRLAETGGNRLRAFSLIGMLLLFQLVFGVLFGAGTSWIAEITGFFVGFALSFLLIHGGLARAMALIRQR
ncbi:MAG: rhomboid family intramembrane serine protease [Paracoccus sp. (in: a-proteobacteria)]|uniref:rhomboid family intramembrane serine protease n=1 Tax=Paracoccus sp. TaxID=267 RepID=UPI0026E0AD97|nr:rhomboid family intramembrane serine protease [Paracoccus sp. (in: a-proteobacteria)]MDO5619932.1 rhomboid family intramembrane serine protease [Paracoccus sp. (in: a-proteobacteria)]